MIPQRVENIIQKQWDIHMQKNEVTAKKKLTQKKKKKLTQSNQRPGYKS